jgi:hypothetical protein
MIGNVSQPDLQTLPGKYVLPASDTGWSPCYDSSGTNFYPKTNHRSTIRFIQTSYIAITKMVYTQKMSIFACIP